MNRSCFIIDHPIIITLLKISSYYVLLFFDNHFYVLLDFFIALVFLYNFPISTYYNPTNLQTLIMHSKKLSSMTLLLLLFFSSLTVITLTLTLSLTLSYTHILNLCQCRLRSPPPPPVKIYPPRNPFWLGIGTKRSKTTTPSQPFSCPKRPIERGRLSEILQTRSPEFSLLSFPSVLRLCQPFLLPWFKPEYWRTDIRCQRFHGMGSSR